MTEEYVITKKFVCWTADTCKSWAKDAQDDRKVPPTEGLDEIFSYTSMWPGIVVQQNNTITKQAQFLVLKGMSQLPLHRYHRIWRFCFWLWHSPIWHRFCPIKRCNDFACGNDQFELLPCRQSGRCPFLNYKIELQNEFHSCRDLL